MKQLLLILRLYFVSFKDACKLVQYFKTKYMKNLKSFYIIFYYILCTEPTRLWKSENKINEIIDIIEYLETIDNEIVMNKKIEVKFSNIPDINSIYKC